MALLSTTTRLVFFGRFIHFYWMRRQWWYEKDCFFFLCATFWDELSLLQYLLLLFFICRQINWNQRDIRLSRFSHLARKRKNMDKNISTYLVSPPWSERARARILFMLWVRIAPVLSVIELQELQETSLSRQRYRIRHTWSDAECSPYTNGIQQKKIK